MMTPAELDVRHEFAVACSREFGRGDAAPADVGVEPCPSLAFCYRVRDQRVAVAPVPVDQVAGRSEKDRYENPFLFPAQSRQRFPEALLPFRLFAL